MTGDFQFEGLTVSDLIHEVFRIKTEVEARELYSGYVAYLRQAPDLEGSAEDVAMSNIGFCFGEGMPSEQIAMWVEAVGAYHPWFG